MSERGVAIIEMGPRTGFFCLVIKRHQRKAKADRQAFHAATIDPSLREDRPTADGRIRNIKTI